MAPMIKLVFCLRRRPELSREEFQRHWREHHAPLVRRHSEVLRLRRYAQVHTLPVGASAALAASRGVEEDEYDGVAELWWDSLEDMQADFGSDEGVFAGEDADTFAVVRQHIYTEEHVLR
jgi:uncharacterized protein (TIGR02118 family)